MIFVRLQFWTRMFQARGLKAPQLVIWNLRGGECKGIPVGPETENFRYYSGFNGDMLKSFMGMMSEGKFEPMPAGDVDEAGPTSVRFDRCNWTEDMLSSLTSVVKYPGYIDLGTVKARMDEAAKKTKDAALQVAVV